MNITEARAVNRLLEAIPAAAAREFPQIIEPAALLADRAYRALRAGADGDDVREAAAGRAGHAWLNGRVSS